MSTLADRKLPAVLGKPGAGRRPTSSRAGRLRGLPTAAWICALVAFLNAACWSVISPPFQLPDEPSHFAYAQHLAQTGHLPSSGSQAFPEAERAAMNYLLQQKVRFSPEYHTIGSLAQQRTLERWLSLPLSRRQPGAAGEAATEPPLYYALETVPYLLGSGGTLLDSLALMRLLSALCGALTALFCFLFLRETLPGARWAWTVGGLAVALAPTVAMMSGAVNPDALLFAVSSALFYCLARAFRRGLTRRLALTIGAVLAAGCLTKLIFLGLLPGALVALALLTVRQARVSGAAAWGSLALALLACAVPVGLYLLDDALSGRSTVQFLANGVAQKGDRGHTGVLSELAYIWQLYLPRLPGMATALHGISGEQIWFERLVGRYGWLDTTFPAWVVKAALLPAALAAVLLARGVVIYRRALWRRRAEIAIYALLCLGVLGVVGASDYRGPAPGEYLQLRYLLPLAAVGAAALTLAARGAGRRWETLAGAFLVLLVLAHDVFSQLLVISRYYG